MNKRNNKGNKIFKKEKKSKVYLRSKICQKLTAISLILILKKNEISIIITTEPRKTGRCFSDH